MLYKPVLETVEGFWALGRIGVFGGRSYEDLSQVLLISTLFRMQTFEFVYIKYIMNNVLVLNITKELCCSHWSV